MISREYAGWLALQAIYCDKPESKIDKILKIGPDVVGIQSVADTFTITIEGTMDWAMWEQNFRIAPKNNTYLGPLHSGFYDAAVAIYNVVKLQASGPISIQGHSRGAAIAVILASLFLLDGINIDQLFAFECPKCGCQQLADFLMRQHTFGALKEFWSTINLLDPVPKVPELIDPKYCAPLPQIELNTKPNGVKALDPISYHMEDLIYSGWLTWCKTH
jgi:hypothetical protein